jgi:hypothetical protein
VSGIVVDEIKERLPVTTAFQGFRPEVGPRPLQAIWKIKELHRLAQARLCHQYSDTSEVTDAIIRAVEIVHESENSRATKRSQHPSWYSRAFKFDFPAFIERYQSADGVGMFQGIIRTCELMREDCGHFFSTVAFLDGRTFYITASRTIGIAPENCNIGDLVVIFAGLDIPCIVRKEGEFSLLVGPAYSDGIMKGEAWTPGSKNLMNFNLV